MATPFIVVYQFTSATGIMPKNKLYGDSLIFQKESG